MDRRLAAIMVTDVVGYSRLMDADEEGILVRLKAHRDEITDPAIANHKGRIVKLIGDGMLAELPRRTKAKWGMSDKGLEFWGF